MGGNAFPGLNVPRLSPTEYIKIRDECIQIVGKFYKQVICPPESPEKADHGDVDLMVSSPLRDFSPSELGEALKAIKRTKGGVTTSFAIPHGSGDAYAQVDVHVCKEGYLEWELWMQGYGDLVQIIGVLNRPIGLTMTDKGLFARVPEIEPTNRRSSMLFLNGDPNKVMNFLGLDSEKYNTGFKTIEEMFVWCSEGRFYQAPSVKGQGETHNDRQRARKRSVFSDFLNNWAPARPEIWAKRASVTREQVLISAISTFGVEEQYSEILDLWRIQISRERKFEAIKSVIPKDDEKTIKETVRALKRWVMFENGKPELKALEDTNEQTPNKDEWLDMVEEDHMDVFLKWVSTNYAELRRRERHWAGSRSGDFLADRRTSEVDNIDIESGN